MAQYVESACRTFQSGAVISSPFLRVKLVSDQLQLCGATDPCIGTLERPVFDVGDYVSVRLRTAQGTQKMVAAAAFAAGSEVYGAANGQITGSSAGGAVYVGTSLDTATAAGDVVEVLPLG